MKKRELAILVGCILPHHSEEQTESSMEELSLLTDTAEAVVHDIMMQKRDRVDATFYIGKGKMQEILEIVEAEELDLVIFNAELTPSQLRNLEKVLPCKVIDRTQLILDIFAMRAKSREGKLQVEMAQLQYMLPRIVGGSAHLSRLGGGIGTRGPGETKLETERRHIRRRISEIKTALQRVVHQRDLYRERRKKNNVWQIALVGYTNAGKSTLLNRLTEAEAYEANQLFATLDPTSRQLKVASGMDILISDTVGFIQELPTTLIAAFRSTLEEVREADLILHLIDSQDHQYLKHIKVVEGLLHELGAGHIPTVRIYTKKDLLLTSDLLIHKQDMHISSLDNADVACVKERIVRELKAQMKYYEISISAGDAELLAKLRQAGFIEEENWNEQDEQYELKVYLPTQHKLNVELTSYEQRE